MYYAVGILIYILALYWVYRLKKGQSDRSLQQRYRFIESIVKRIDHIALNYYPKRSNNHIIPDVYSLLKRTFFWIGGPIILIVLYDNIQAAIFLPQNAYAYSSDAFSIVLFALGAFVTSIALSNLLIPIVYEKIIVKVNGYGQKSRSESSNGFRSGICLLFGLPLLMISMHIFTYYTDQGIVFQGTFTSETVIYDQIQFAEVQWNQQNGNLEYYIYYGDNTKLDVKRIYGENTENLDIRQVDDMLIQNNTDVRRNRVTQAQLKMIESGKSVRLKELVIALCGVSS